MNALNSLDVSLAAPRLLALDASARAPGLAAVIAPGLLLIGGLTLWLAGGRLLKSGVVLTGFALGGLIGGLVGGFLAGGMGALVAGLIGAIAGGLAGWTFFRAATAICFGVALGIGAAVVGLAISGVLGGGQEGRPAALVALLDEPEPEPDPEDLPTGLGGGEQPVVAPPEVPRLPDEPVMDPGPNPGETEDPATAPNPSTVTPKRAERPKRTDQPGAPGKAPAPRAPAKAAGAGEAKESGRRDGRAAPKPAAGARAGAAVQRSESARSRPGLGTGTLGLIDVNAPAEAAGEISAGARHIGAVLGQWWREASGLVKGWVVGLGLLGAVAGLLGGLFLPKKAAGVLTSAAGAALWPAGLLMMAEALDWGWPRFGMMPPLAWVMAWLVLTFVGVAVQASWGKAKGGEAVKGARKSAR